MKTFFILFGCVLFAKSYASQDFVAIIDGVFSTIAYTPVTCDEWTVDIVDTCEDISYVKRTKQVVTDGGIVVQGVWYYPSETIGIKGKYGLNPFIFGFYQTTLQVFGNREEPAQEAIVREMANCNTWTGILDCLNNISNQDITFQNETRQCNETVKDLFLNTMSEGMSFFLKLPKNDECTDIFDTTLFDNAKELNGLPINTTLQATIRSQSKGMSTGVIIGIVVGSVAFVVGVGVSIWYLKRKPVSKSADQEMFL